MRRSTFFVPALSFELKHIFDCDSGANNNAVRTFVSTLVGVTHVENSVVIIPV